MLWMLLLLLLVRLQRFCSICVFIAKYCCIAFGPSVHVVTVSRTVRPTQCSTSAAITAYPGQSQSAAQQFFESRRLEEQAPTPMCSKMASGGKCTLHQPPISIKPAQHLLNRFKPANSSKPPPMSTLDAASAQHLQAHHCQAGVVLLGLRHGEADLPGGQQAVRSYVAKCSHHNGQLLWPQNAHPTPNAGPRNLTGQLSCQCD